MQHPSIHCTPNILGNNTSTSSVMPRQRPLKHPIFLRPALRKSVHQTTPVMGLQGVLVPAAVIATSNQMEEEGEVRIRIMKTHPGRPPRTKVATMDATLPTKDEPLLPRLRPRVHLHGPSGKRNVMTAELLMIGMLSAINIKHPVRVYTRSRSSIVA